MNAEPGVVAWGVLTAGVVAYDTWAVKNDSQTLTQAFHGGLEHPIWKYMCVGALGATALHLSHVLPREWDIFYISD